MFSSVEKENRAARSRVELMNPLMPHLKNSLKYETHTNYSRCTALEPRGSYLHPPPTLFCFLYNCMTPPSDASTKRCKSPRCYYFYVQYCTVHFTSFNTPRNSTRHGTAQHRTRISCIPVNTKWEKLMWNILLISPVKNIPRMIFWASLILKGNEALNRENLFLFWFLAFNN